MGRSPNALWVRPFRHLRLLRSEVEKILSFQAATDPSANQLALCGANSIEGVSPPPSDTPSMKSTPGRYAAGDVTWEYRLMDAR